MPNNIASKPKLAISACLLGAEVRYNGGHKESRLCSHVLAEHFDFVALCPEMAIGLGTPRPALRLVGDPQAPRAQGSRDSQLDVTEALQDYATRMAAELNDICGYIFMHKSPSCGLQRVKVYQDNGYPAAEGSAGLYSATFQRLRPDLPVEEEGRLNDPILRENFLTRVYAYAEWQRLLASGLSRRAITDFHARYKYQLLAHNPAQYQVLGRLLGELGRHDPAEVGPRYFTLLMAALQKCATRGTHSNVLQHLGGYLKQALSGADRQELQQLIEQYRRGIVPLVVPLTLLKHHLRHHPARYVAQQAY
ncbi:MAG TPA: DUF523 and DUF1722 domain-containing protein, partial [Pseudomonas sp.]|nr:DUF523 and DUF1722 domain-containing protein [Pseudomonas sp.]